jgi:SAM-dependent methyltransferase
MARQRGIPIVCEDVFAYLEGLPSNGLDGIFASHFVEHLPYQEVLRLFELSYQVLRPNGIIVVTTPNVRGLYSHLEMFWLHFGHVSFYHPRLLCFFLEHVGFTEPASGENPYTASPLMSDLRAHFSEPKSKDAPSWNALSSRQPHEGRLTIPIDYQRMLPLQGRSWWCRLSRHAKMFLARMIVQPYLDQLVDRINIVLQEINRMLTSLQIAAAQLRSDNDLIAATNDLIAATLLRLDRPFECYVTARKPRESYQNQNVEV